MIGSGATAGNLGRLVEVADTIIVGTSIKVDKVATGPVDVLSAAAFVDAAHDHGLLSDRCASWSLATSP